jgi:glycerophosphoryl diester phosphodiesterase
MVWTVNEIERAQELRELGVTAVCTDDPRRISAARLSTDRIG